MSAADPRPPATTVVEPAAYRLRVNGVVHDVADSWLGESLLYVLRERLGLPGAKNACEQGECGSCSVTLDGRLVCSCLVLAAGAVDRDIETVESLGDDGVLSDVQHAFVETGAVQCGFCTPGLVVATATCSGACRGRATTRSARRSPATCAAAPATRRSSTL